MGNEKLNTDNDGEENEEEEDDGGEGPSNIEQDGFEFDEDVGEGVFRMLPATNRYGSNVVMIQDNFDIDASTSVVSQRQVLP